MTSLGALSPDDANFAALRRGLALETADHMIENVVAVYDLPLAIVTDLVINGHAVLAPLVSEDGAVAPACSRAARLAQLGGGFSAGSSEPIMIGQIQVLDVPDAAMARQRLLQSSPELIDWLNTRNPATISRHARAVGIEIRELEIGDLRTHHIDQRDTATSPYTNLQTLISNPQSPIPNPQSPDMLAIHILYDCGDAMGANLVNTACEALVPQMELLTGGRVNLRILSNLSDRRRAWATCRLPASASSVMDRGRNAARAGYTLFERITTASEFTANDPWAAAVHNKRVMDGIDGLVMATGNDWRAIQAGAYAYAARGGSLLPLARWSTDATGNLIGEIDLPLAVGIVGGATRAHPQAQAVLGMMAVGSARSLAEAIACVGLAMSLSALLDELV